MSRVLVEFVGGPLDGKRLWMPDARPRWVFPQTPTRSFVGSNRLDMCMSRPLIYEHTNAVVEISADRANRYLLYELQP